MKTKSEYWYAVVECSTTLVLNTGVSHWVYKSIQEANEQKELMQSLNSDLIFVVLHLNKR